MIVFTFILIGIWALALLALGHAREVTPSWQPLWGRRPGGFAAVLIGIALVLTAVWLAMVLSGRAYAAPRPRTTCGSGPPGYCSVVITPYCRITVRNGETVPDIDYRECADWRAAVRAFDR